MATASLLLVLLMLVLLVHSSGFSRKKSGLRGNKSPERGEIYDLLAKQGCKNKLIASYVIEASLGKVNAKTLKIRINSISGYSLTESTLTKWINVVTTYYA